MGKTLLVSAFSNIKAESNNRLRTIFNQIDGSKLVITTDFNHTQKRYYFEDEASCDSQILIHVPKYKKNLSIHRIWSHLMFARRLGKYLNRLEEKPHVIYCTMPTSSSAYVCAKFCKRFNIKFVIDVIDLWPDSLMPFVKSKKVINALLYPWTYLSMYAYKSADVIIGESVKYAKEAKKYNFKAKVYPIYLGVDMEIIKNVKANNPVHLIKPKDEIWIGYAGSLGESYDFAVLLTSINQIHGKYKYKLWFIGDGVRHNDILNYTNAHRLNTEITGFLPYDQLLGYLSYCDIAINIFRKDTKVVYSYKFNDYVAMDCFVLNSLEGETSEMVDKYKIGRNFNFSDKPLSKILGSTLHDWPSYKTWKSNGKKLISDKLDKDKIYNVINDIFK